MRPVLPVVRALTAPAWLRELLQALLDEDDTPLTDEDDSPLTT